MTCSINFLINGFSSRLLLVLLLFGIFLNGCGGGGLQSTDSQRKESELQIFSLVVGKPAPQMAGTDPIIWTVTATGGTGELTNRFELKRDDGWFKVIQSGPASTLKWLPEKAGNYRVRVIIEDSIENRVEGAWSEPYEITPPLVIESLSADKSFPQAAQSVPIVWTVTATGGVGELTQSFELEKDGKRLPMIVAEGLEPWSWSPEVPGSYRIRAVVSDALGNRTAGEWSGPFVITPPLEIESLSADKSFPQAAQSVPIVWTVSASGGVGELRQSFELEKDGKRLPMITAEGLGPWSWSPEVPGSYRIRAVVTDALGNRTEGEWSGPFVIVPPLMVEKLYADRPSPQAAQTGPITWIVDATGGVGATSYAFEISRNEETGPLTLQGVDKTWPWTPTKEGSYRIRTVVTDALGNQLTSDWSEAYDIVPPLQVTVPQPDITANQHMVQSSVSWKVQSSGGVGKITYSFIHESKTGETASPQTGSSSVWTWRPANAGFYRVRVLVTDALGNLKKSSWSDWMEVRDLLSLNVLIPSLPSPQQALQETIRWKAEISGGVGAINYEFRSIMGGVESIEQTGPSPELNWSPRLAGKYRMMVRAWDADDHVIESHWSDEYLITPTVTADTLIAFLPMQNLTDVKVSGREISNMYRGMLGSELSLLSSDKLEHFMAKHRMRYTGGISSTLAKALREETGVEAVFITNLETWFDRGEPRVSLHSRLVTTGETPEIVWIDSVGLTGGDSPGLLDLGRIDSTPELLQKALIQLIDSLRGYLAGHYPSYHHAADQQGLRLVNGKTGTADGMIGQVKGRHQPQFSYRASNFDPAGQYKIAVIPFLNINARKHAGRIVTLHAVKQFHRYANLRVVEPGVIRESLLRYRMIMQSGPSLAASDVLADSIILGADIIVSGRVFDYQGDVGNSKVDFSMLAFDGARREVVWASRSYAVGDAGVFFFDWGRVPSAHGLMSRMMQSVVNLLQE
ncbi:MAG: hypothetical protein IH613_03645 [Desulfuromonadales bacterium]|nr:hypothetical protein [Desulfuromonadales bacterium]